MVFSFFKKYIKNKTLAGVAEHPFYNQRLYLKGSKLTITQHENDQRQLDLTQIKWVYMEHHGASLSGHPNCWLTIGHFGEDGNISICTVADQFEIFENYILGLPQFDVETYLRIKQANQQHEGVNLFHQSFVDDYQLIPQQHLARSLAEGIYLEDRQQYLPWVDYQDIVNLDTTQHSLNYPNPDYRGTRFIWENVQIFNGLKVSKIYTETTAQRGKMRLDIPILEYEVELQAARVRERFLQLAAHLDQYFQAQGELIDTAEELSYQYQQGKCCIRLTSYWNENQGDYFNPLRLRIIREPDLSRFYESALLSGLALAQLQVLRIPATYHDREDYLTVDNKFYTPAHFQVEAGQTLVWLSQEHKCFGFSNAEFSRMFGLGEVDHIVLSIQNWRGQQGRNQLLFYLGNQCLWADMSVADTAIFLDYASDLQQLLNIPFIEEHYDDHY